MPRAFAVLQASVLIFLFFSLLACASVGTRPEPPRVSLTGLTLLGADMLEQRYELRLRIKNTNDFPLRIRGLDYRLKLNEREFADGVSGERVEVPAFGEAAMTVQATSNLLRIFEQVRDMGDGEAGLRYELEGKVALDGLAMRLPFAFKGEIAPPR